MVLQKNILCYLISTLLLVFLTIPCSAIENSSKLYEKGAREALAGNIDQAIEIFKKVIEISPHYTLGHYGLGKAYLYKKGKLKEAILHLKISIDLDKKFAKGYFYLGMAYYFSTNYIQAIHAFKKAYQYDESMIEVLYNLSMIYDIIDRDFMAREYYRKYNHEKTRDEDFIF